MRITMNADYFLVVADAPNYRPEIRIGILEWRENAAGYEVILNQALVRDRVENPRA
jgi:hypothetical protein